MSDQGAKPPLTYGQLGYSSRVNVDDDGIRVTDTAGTVRARLGKLPSGSYGITITDSSGNVLIDGAKIQLTYSEGTIPAGVNVGISQTTVTANGLEVKVSGVTRVIAGQITTGVYGLKVVSTDGSTVIIDGTSEIFVIAASGSLSLAVAATTTARSDSTSATLTSLGTQTTILGHIGWMSTSLSVNEARTIGTMFSYYAPEIYGASTSGGATTARALWLGAFVQSSTQLNGSNQLQVFLASQSTVNSAITYRLQYYVLTIEAL